MIFEGNQKEGYKGRSQKNNKLLFFYEQKCDKIINTEVDLPSDIIYEYAQERNGGRL